MPLLESFVIISFYGANLLLHISHVLTTSKVMDMPHNDDLHAVVNEHKKKKSHGDI
jgi:hypothetical protein